MARKKKSKVEQPERINYLSSREWNAAMRRRLRPKAEKVMDVMGTLAESGDVAAAALFLKKTVPDATIKDPLDDKMTKPELTIKVRQDD